MKKLLKETVGGKDIHYYDSDDIVIAALKNGKLFGEANFNLLKNFIKGSGVIIDCGSHIGTFSVPAAMSGYEVVSIDGAIQNAECLSLTAKQFSKNRIHVLNEIISDRISRCSFSSEYGPFGSRVEDAAGSLMSNTIDNICEINKYDKVCAIKYDIEGGEIEALRGSKNILDKQKPPLLVEVNPIVLYKRNSSPRALLDEIKSFNYEAYIIRWAAGNAYRIDENLPTDVVDVVCIHKDKKKEHDILDAHEEYEGFAGAGASATSLRNAQAHTARLEGSHTNSFSDIDE